MRLIRALGSALLVLAISCGVDPSQASSEGAPASPTPPPGRDHPVILDPENTDAALLRSLHSIWIPIGIPDEWRGPYTVCTRIEEGWNECLDLSPPVSPVVELGAYLGDGRRLEFWLLDGGADVRNPLQRLGVADLSFLSEAELTARSGLVIRVDLVGEFSKRLGEVRNPDVVIGDIATWEQLLGDPKRFEAVIGSPYPS